MRFFHWLYAHLFNYFWLPCPICGKNFGGHEWKPEATLFNSYHAGEGVCQNCAEEAQKRNRKFFAENPVPVRVQEQR
jgi:hypothetical protein